MSARISVILNSKTASSVSSCDPNDLEITAELRHRRGNRHSCEDTSSDMIQLDENSGGIKENEGEESGIIHSNRRQSESSEIESYRPLKSILKSTNFDKNNISDDAPLKLNRSDLEDGLDGEFIGEFTPRSGKDDFELEPLITGADGPSKSTYENKAFSVDGDDEDVLFDQSSGNRGKKSKSDKRSVSKQLSTGEYTTSEPSESSLRILIQVSFPFFIAGCGTVGAGLVLDKVQHHRVFSEVPQIFILVPALLGLKGNLEMTLASRLSTLANLGRMDTRKEKMRQIIGNLALIQAQASVIAFLAAAFAIILGWIPKGEFRLDHAMLLCASSLATASLASFILGGIMIGVVLLSRAANINPDNVATPIAASLGDLTTLSLLAAAGGLLVESTEDKFWVAPFIIAIFILLCPLWIWISAENPVTREVLISGWSPVLFSMLISSAGGFILEYTVARYRGIAVFQPVINGIGGNLVAVQASRISTSLHQESRLGVLPPSAPNLCFNPCQAFFGKGNHCKAARVLLSLVIPGHLVFMYMIHFLRAGHTPITPLFATLYCTAAFIQVLILLYVCIIMIHSMWKEKIDPDNSAIPYLTALGDLLGTGLLAIAFHILYAVGDSEVRDIN